MRAICVIASLGGWLAASNAAHADWLSTTFDQPIAETLHAVDIELEDGSAVYTVRRTFVNDGRERDELMLTIDLPAGGSLSGLRVKTGGRWLPSRVMDADAASLRYEELRMVGEAKPKLAAELRLADPGVAELRLFPFGAKRSITVEYVVIAPVHRHEGKIYLHVPRGTTDGDEGTRKPIVRIDPKHATRVEPVPAGMLPELDTDDPDVSYSELEGWMSAVPARPPKMGELQARFATYALSSGTWIWRLEVDVAAVLGEVPRNARVIFVIDASRSVGKDGIAAQIDLARGYLEHLPDAMFEIVVFRRRAMRLFGKWQPAGELDEALAELHESSLLPGNGSSLDRGLAMAVDLAANEAGGRPVRILAMTDGMLREGFDPDAAASSLDGLPSTAMVHLIERSDLSGALEEDEVDEGPLADVVERGRAIAVWIRGDSSNPREVVDVMRGLVRPVRIDELSVEGTDQDFYLPDVLEEGAGVRRMGTGDPETPPPREIKLIGTIWGRPFEKKLTVDPGLLRKLPALALASEIEGDLDDEEVAAMATAANVVSRTTSLFVEERGADPHTAGYDTLTLSGSVSTSCGCRVSVVGCSFGSGRSRAGDDLEAILRSWLEPAVATCAAREGARRADIEVTVEITEDEVVDVSASGEVPAAALTCAEEAAWSLTLDARFRGARRIPVMMRVGDGDDAPAEPPRRFEDFLL